MKHGLVRPVRPQSLLPATPHAVPLCLSAFPLTSQKSIPADDDGARSSRQHRWHATTFSATGQAGTRNDGS